MLIMFSEPKVTFQRVKLLLYASRRLKTWLLIDCQKWQTKAAQPYIYEAGNNIYLMILLETRLKWLIDCLNSYRFIFFWLTNWVNRCSSTQLCDIHCEARDIFWTCFELWSFANISGNNYSVSSVSSWFTIVRDLMSVRIHFLEIP